MIDIEKPHRWLPWKCMRFITFQNGGVNIFMSILLLFVIVWIYIYWQSYKKNKTYSMYVKKNDFSITNNNTSLPPLILSTTHPPLRQSPSPARSSRGTPRGWTPTQQRHLHGRHAAHLHAGARRKERQNVPLWSWGWERNTQIIKSFPKITVWFAF